MGPVQADDVGDDHSTDRRRSGSALAIGVALALLAVLTAAPAGARTETGFLTVANGTADQIDVYIDGQRAGIRLQPDDLGREFSLPAGPHTVEIYLAGSAAREANLVARAETSVPAAAGVTVVAFGDAEIGPEVSLETFPNPGSVGPDESCILLRHVAQAGPTRLLVDGHPVGDTVSTGSSTRPAALPPGLVDLGLEGLDTTPAQADLAPGSCVAVHARGNADVIVTLVVQTITPRGEVASAEPRPAGPAELTVVNARQGLAVDFRDSRATTRLEPLSGVETLIPNGPLVARFIDLDGNPMAESAMTVTSESRLTIALHETGIGDETATAVFDDAELVADEGWACVDVRVLTNSTPVSVAIGDRPAGTTLAVGAATGPIQTAPGATTITIDTAGRETATTSLLDEGSCTALYLLDTPDGPGLFALTDLLAGLATEVEPEVAGTQTALPVTGQSDVAVPIALFALGVIVFGYGLSQRAHARTELEKALARVTTRP